jgi:hypothetical protein
MKRDLFVISVGMLAVGVMAWSFWGNPRGTPGMQTVQTLHEAPNVSVMIVSKRSPFMRTER